MAIFVQTYIANIGHSFGQISDPFAELFLFQNDIICLCFLLCNQSFDAAQKYIILVQKVKENDILQFTRLLFSLKLICCEPNVTRRIDDIWYLLKRASDI